MAASQKIDLNDPGENAEGLARALIAAMQPDEYLPLIESLSRIVGIGPDGGLARKSMDPLDWADAPEASADIASLAGFDGDGAIKKALPEAVVELITYTAADVLAKLLTVDGAGSGIDADLLDGQNGSYYRDAATLAGASLDTDGALTANSDIKLATQKAVKTYVDNILAVQDAMVFKGVIDCSANPNYPAANRGWTYRVSVAGKIGGASGPNVEVGDILICITDGTASGNQATVGAQWTIIQVNIDGALTTANIGSTVQAFNAKLSAFSGLSPANNQIPLFTGASAMRLMSLLGTVSQSAGAPTGDLFQVTANANGISIRFPFNLQLCFGYDATGLDCNTAQGGGFVQSAAGAWPFPQNFTTTWQGFGAAFSTNQVRVGSQGSWTTSSLAYGNKAFTSSGTPVPLGLFAAGPWY